MGGPGGGFVAGVADYGAAHRLLFATGLWKLFLVPGLLSVLYVPCSLVAGYLLLRRLPGFLHDHWIPGFLQSGLTMSVLSVLTAMVGVALGFILFRNVIMILYSPFLGLLSEATERAVSGPGTAEGGIRIPFGEIVRSAVRGSSLSLLTLMLAAVGLLLACLMALLPVLGTLLGSIVTALVTWFLAGAGFGHHAHQPFKRIDLRAVKMRNSIPALNFGNVGRTTQSHIHHQHALCFWQAKRLCNAAVNTLHLHTRKTEFCCTSVCPRNSDFDSDADHN